MPVDKTDLDIIITAYQALPAWRKGHWDSLAESALGRLMSEKVVSVMPHSAGFRCHTLKLFPVLHRFHLYRCADSLQQARLDFMLSLGGRHVSAGSHFMNVSVSGKISRTERLYYGDMVYARSLAGYHLIARSK